MNLIPLGFEMSFKWQKVTEIRWHNTAFITRMFLMKRGIICAFGTWQDWLTANSFQSKFTKTFEKLLDTGCNGDYFSLSDKRVYSKSSTISSWTGINTDQCNMSNVIPDVSQCLVISQWQRSLKASQGHIILLSIKTAQSQVVEQFSVIKSHL